MGNLAEFRDVLSLVARGELVPQIDRVLPLEEIAEGHRAIENRAIFGKIVLQP